VRVISSSSVIGLKEAAFVDLVMKVSVPVGGRVVGPSVVVEGFAVWVSWTLRVVVLVGGGRSKVSVDVTSEAGCCCVTVGELPPRVAVRPSVTSCDDCAVLVAEGGFGSAVTV
jgi:hypothetical protein